MRLKPIAAFSFIVVAIFPYLVSCTDRVDDDKAGKKKNHTSPDGYDLTQPIAIKLPLELDEISGVAYYAKDTSLFAIQDESGLLYKIPLNRPQNIEKWKYKKGADYEDVVLLNESFFVLVSNGDIVGVRFLSEDSIQESKFKFPFDKGSEFEILFYDATINKLRLICKDCESDKKKYLSGYLFDPVTHEYSEDPVRIDVQSITALLGKDKMKFKPSAAAINPATHELFIISAINKLLVIVDKTGKAKEVHRLDKANFKQPEGLTFSPGGTMFISNEAADIGVANILIFPRKSLKDTAQ